MARPPKSVLIVDGANVVGARADGWWKDRPGAAARLHHELLVADVGYDVVVLVLEGQAKQGVRAGRDVHVRTVHAPKDGDATIVKEAEAAVAAWQERADMQVVGRAARVVVVTADRALDARVHGVGATTVGPTWLLSRLAE